MTEGALSQPDAQPTAAPTPGFIILLATACGLIVGNLYYAQPLIGVIAPDLGLQASAASLVVTITQAGYCMGLIFLVPLGDLKENRSVIVWTLAGGCIALTAATLAPSAPWFLAASLCVGFGSVAIQMLVPIAAHCSPAAMRGRVVGTVMTGLLLGIMLARPVASLVASVAGWRTLYGASAAIMAILVVVLRLALPTRRPDVRHTYAGLLRSMVTLFAKTPELRRRAAYQAAMFGAFSLYWTAVPLLLAGPSFNFSQRGISLFALAGVSGALAAPVAGRLADRGHTQVATGASLALAAIAFGMARGGGEGALGWLLAGGILLDLSVQANLVLGQRAIFSLDAAVRSRLNALYLAIFFGGGALGSALASLALVHGGWSTVCWIGISFPVLALLYYGTEFSTTRARTGFIGEDQHGS